MNNGQGFGRWLKDKWGRVNRYYLKLILEQAGGMRVVIQSGFVVQWLGHVAVNHGIGVRVPAFPLKLKQQFKKLFAQKKRKELSNASIVQR